MYIRSANTMFLFRLKSVKWSCVSRIKDTLTETNGMFKVCY